MSTRRTITVNVDQYLARNRYEVDEEHAHITLVEHPDPIELDELVRVCPAALYKVDEAGDPTFDHAGCLECGTCRIVAEGRAVARWEFPRPTMGVEYRYG